MFFKDSPTAMDHTNPFDGIISGLIIRQRFTNMNASCDMQGPLMADVCHLDRYMLNGVEIRIKLWPTVLELNLMADSSAHRHCQVKT